VRIEIFPQIERDLDQITEYIATHNPSRAISFVAELRLEFRTIATNPKGYQEHPEIGAGFRKAVFGEYLILFRIHEKVVEIRRVVHGARNLKNLTF
jgi:toxin ParE1/3/4